MAALGADGTFHARMSLLGKGPWALAHTHVAVLSKSPLALTHTTLALI